MRDLGDSKPPVGHLDGSKPLVRDGGDSKPSVGHLDGAKPSVRDLDR